MSAPLQLPVRVLVKGASTVLWTSWMGGPRTNLAFPRAIEADLLNRGRAAEVRNSGVLAQPTLAGTQAWESDIVSWSPDVIVLFYGHYETIHLLLPHWFERRANKVIPRRPLSAAYRKLLLRPAWKLACEFQAAVDRRVGRFVARRRARKVAGDLERFSAVAQQMSTPLIILMEILPPGSRARQWFPGMAERVTEVNAAVSEMVSRADKPWLKHFRTSDVARAVAGEDPDAATPDGFHFTPELHRAIGAALAHEIDTWAKCQPHLSLLGQSG